MRTVKDCRDSFYVKEKQEHGNGRHFVADTFLDGEWPHKSKINCEILGIHFARYFRLGINLVGTFLSFFFVVEALVFVFFVVFFVLSRNTCRRWLSGHRRNQINGRHSSQNRLGLRKYTRRSFQNSRSSEECSSTRSPKSSSDFALFRVTDDGWNRLGFGLFFVVVVVVFFLIALDFVPVCGKWMADPRENVVAAYFGSRKTDPRACGNPRVTSERRWRDTFLFFSFLFTRRLDNKNQRI